MVFPLSPTLVAYFFFICILLAMGTGAATGAVASCCLRLPVHGILRDALLGAAGFLVGFAVIVLVRPLGHALVNHFISPIAVALVVAAMFPLSRAIFRLRHPRSR
jgi:predicted Co/Zn/Cd cation transporter (cation efflux family)